MVRSSASATAAAVPRQLTRRLILGTALLIGLAVALTPRTPSVYAQEPKPSPLIPAKPTTSKTVTISDGRGSEAKMTLELKDAADPATNATANDAAAAADMASDAARKATSSLVGATIGRHGRVRVNGLGADREFDSFDQFVHDEPTIAGMVIAIVSVVFLSPVLAIGLILWYRMRKARMLNETMLKLAEKGIVPPAEAMNALAGGKQAAVLSSAAAAPLYEQAKQIRRRAAWSDLRKGVILGGIGLGLTLWSVLDDRSPNSVGLVLLFVGIGYIVLWWFEERQLVPAAGVTPGVDAPGSTPGIPPPSA